MLLLATWYGVQTKKPGTPGADRTGVRSALNEPPPPTRWPAGRLADHCSTLWTGRTGGRGARGEAIDRAAKRRARQRAPSGEHCDSTAPGTVAGWHVSTGVWTGGTPASIIPRTATSEYQTPPPLAWPWPCVLLVLGGINGRWSCSTSMAPCRRRGSSSSCANSAMHAAASACPPSRGFALARKTFPH